MNKIEFFVMALVGLYLCSCGNKQIGKEELCGIWIQPVPRSHIVQGLKLTPDSLILRSLLVFRLALKLLNVDDEPLVSAFADKSALIEHLHLATANVRSNIRRCHGRLLTTPYSRFYHNKQILFVSLSYEINKCVNL